MKPDLNYICTERAHFMCPNMHFGIMAEMAGGYDGKRVRQSVDVLQKAHPFLQSLIAEEEGSGRLYYQFQDRLEVVVTEKREEDLWQRDYDEVSCRGWDVRKECLLKVLVYPKTDGFEILFVAHHLLCDGRGLLQLAEEFAQHYVKGVVPGFVEERLIRSIRDLPEKSDLPFVSRWIISHANKKWKKERHRVSYDEYAAFERDYIRKNSVERKVTVVDSQELGQIQALCKEQEISVNDYLIARMMKENDVNKVVIAADIRTYTGCYEEGAMGNYSTAFSVTAGKRDGDILALAKCVALKVADIMQHPRKKMLVLACYLRMYPELIDAVTISTLGDFSSKAGAFVGKNMFGYGTGDGYSITNLGKIQSDVMISAVFVPPASPANKVTWGVFTVNGCMKICSAISTHCHLNEKL